MLDILIQNGLVVDGTGKPRKRADVAIAGDSIVEIGILEEAKAEIIIDASGQVITPGFIDMHSHADFSLPICPTADSLVHQGITTAVIGQCGSSPAPLLEETRQEIIAARENEDLPLPWEKWSTFESYLKYLEEMKISINVVTLVGQGTIRAGIMGFSASPPTQEQVSQMQMEVVKAMDAGAIGISTGLIYPPSSYASTEELIEVVRPVGEQGGFYFSHIRGEGDTLLEAVSEAIRIGQETGTAVQISHFKAAGQQNWYKSVKALEMIEKAQGGGLDITADMYPYLAGSTSLIALLPEWAQEGGKEATLKRLAENETRCKMIENMQSFGRLREASWDKILICRSPKNRSYEGKYIAELAKEAGKSPYHWLFDALLETKLDIGMILFMMSEENRRLELRHLAMMIGTDGYGLSPQGPLARGLPHPRSYGTYPHILGNYVRQQGILSLEEAIYKMTGFPAKKLRLKDRGLLEKGYKADLVVLNPDTVIDQATYEMPHQYPLGINQVVVNGKLVIHNCSHTKTRPGRILRR